MCTSIILVCCWVMSSFKRFNYIEVSNWVYNAFCQVRRIQIDCLLVMVFFIIVISIIFIIYSLCIIQLKVSNSKSNTSSLFPGIKPGNPLSPYAREEGIVIFALSPILSWATPRSRPGMTCSAPNLNLKGLFLSLDESNLLPSGRYLQLKSDFS